VGKDVLQASLGNPCITWFAAGNLTVRYPRGGLDCARLQISNKNCLLQMNNSRANQIKSGESKSGQGYTTGRQQYQNSNPGPLRPSCVIVH